MDKLPVWLNANIESEGEFIDPQWQALQELQILWLLVSIADQRLYGLTGLTQVKFSYPISSAIKGIGNQLNSYQTPLGLHKIAEKIGDHLPLGAVLEGRKPTGEILASPKNISASQGELKSSAQAPAPTQAPTLADLPDSIITCRILRLKGLQAGYNQGQSAEGYCVDSYERMIYIHGTNLTDRLGQPASKGCIHLADEDVVELYEAVSVETLVLFTPATADF